MKMSKIRTLLVDDEPLALRGLQIRLEKFNDIEIIGTCANGREAIKKIRAERPALVFLDIQMPGFDGFAVIKALAAEELPLIVFATAFDEYAIDAFKSHALDYLLKPIDEDLLTGTISRVREQISERLAIEQNSKLVRLIENMNDTDSKIELAQIVSQSDLKQESRFETHFNIKDRGHTTMLDVKTIEYIDAAGDYMCLHAGDKTHILRETMKNMEKRLDPEHFQRVHRSTIVNLANVTEVHNATGGKYKLILKSAAELQVSRNYRDVLAKFL